jgi:hypothetical protein
MPRDRRPGAVYLGEEVTQGYAAQVCPHGRSTQ